MQGGSPARNDQTGIALVPRWRTLASARSKGKRGRHVDEMQSAWCKERWFLVKFGFVDRWLLGAPEPKEGEE